MEKYETIDFLGEGSFAKVSKAKDLKTGDTVAIKKLKKKYSTWQECVDLREVKSLNKLKQNDNIIKLKEMIRIEDTLHLVFEYMEKNLYQLITERQNRKFNEAQIKCILYQTLQGVAYMHKYGFFHRDLKPENLLVNGEKIKLADFGLAREIRSIPPYTDYVCTRYYRAPECILKSTNYNSPVDIWAVGCIMAELYTFRPLFYGSSEKEVLFRIASVIGTPNANNWPEGLQLAKKLDVKFPATLSNCTSLSQMIPEASKEAIDLMSEMLKWDPNKRTTAINLLQHPFFTSYPIPNRISTPELNVGNIKENSGKKTYSSANHQNKNISINIQNENSSNIFSKNIAKNKDSTPYVPKKDDDEISKLLADTVGFNNFLHKLKNEKLEDDMKFDIEQAKTNYFKDQISPIANKLDEEFDFEMEKIFNNKEKIAEGNSLLNMNITNLTNTYLNQNGNLTGKIFESFKNKNFFDNSVINKINSIRESSPNQKTPNVANKDAGKSSENDAKDEDENIIISARRKINLSNNGIVKINSNNNSDKELIHKNTNENAESNENKIKEKVNDLEFENGNVYLKNTNPNNNRPNSRKRSAFKYIEDNLEKVKSSNSNDPTNNLIKNLYLNDNNNYNSYNAKVVDNCLKTNNLGFIHSEHKPKIMQSENFLNDKKPEYESRRKKQMNFMNCIENITQDNKAKGNSSNLIESQTQKNLQKFNDNNTLYANTNNIYSGNYESRRIQANYSKSTMLKDKEGDNLTRNKNIFNK